MKPVKMNIFSLHYFLWALALSPIYSYVSVYAEHYANTTSSQYGLLNMVLPFLTILSNVFFCSLADRHRAHRIIFLGFLLVALFGYGSYAILPFIVKPLPKASGLDLNTWIAICAITSVSTIAMGVITCLSDALAVNSSLRHNTSFGRIRVWGTLGWAVGSILLMYINQSDRLPLLVPGLTLTSVFILADVLLVLLWPNKEDFKLDQLRRADCNDLAREPNHKLKVDPQPMDSSDGIIEEGLLHEPTLDAGKFPKSPDRGDISSIRIQWKLFMEVARRRKSIFLYMLLFLLSGAAISIHWSYFFLYLKSIHAKDFAFVSGFAMMVDSMIELPFFWLSDSAIRVLGIDHTLSFSFVSMGSRFLLYEYLLPKSSMYFVIIPEMLHGPGFGLFYVAMTEVANEYSECGDAISAVLNEESVANEPENVRKLRQILRATMQSIVSSCYEGLGLGIGSIVGGLTIQYLGFHNLWLYSASLCLLVGLATSASAFMFPLRQTPSWTIPIQMIC